MTTKADEVAGDAEFEARMRERMRENGRKGGHARAAALTAEERARIAARGGRAKAERKKLLGG